MTRSAESPRPRRVVVVGGGIAGLSVAVALERAATEEAPLEVVVLEAAPRPGGNIRSERLSGSLCEWGPNGFLDNAPATLELVARLGLEERLLVSSDSARRRFIFRNGALRSVPDGIGSFLRSDLLSWPGKLRLLGEPFSRARVQEDESIHEFARRRIGHEAAEVLIGSMVSGVFAGDSRELSLRACFPRMREMEDEHGSLFRAMLARRRAKRRGDGLDSLRPAPGAPAGDDRTSGGSNPHPREKGAIGMPGGRLTSFREGLQELIDALGRRLGQVLRVGTGARSLHAIDGRSSSDPEGLRHGRWWIETTKGERIEADSVVLTLPAREAAPLTRALDSDLAGLLLEIESAPLLVVCLGYERSQLPYPLDGFGFLVAPGQGPRILGALWDSSIFPNRAPEGSVLIRVMLGGARDPSAIDLVDEAVLDLVRKDLATTMRLDRSAGFARIFRHPGGIPQYTLGHHARLRRMEARLASHPGLYLAGSSYRGVSINACIQDSGPLALSIRDELMGRPRPPTT